MQAHGVRGRLARVGDVVVRDGGIDHLAGVVRLLVGGNGVTSFEQLLRQLERMGLEAHQFLVAFVGDTIAVGVNVEGQT